MRSVPSTILCLTLLILIVANIQAADPNDFEVFSHPQVPGRLYVPPEAATSTDPLPLILFLHGAGETGINNTSQVNGNIDNLFDEAIARAAFLYAPQASTPTWSDPMRNDIVVSMIDQALTMYNVDSDRLYVTGLSMGGGGAWEMLNGYANRFAAGVPIAGRAPGSSFDGSNLIGKPTWAFHARNDTVVPVTSSRGVVDDILADASAAALTYPGVNDLATLRYANEEVALNYTELSTGGHGIWGPVYDTPELYEWMFSMSLETPQPVAPADGSQVNMNNVTSFLPIGDAQGMALPAGVGFTAAGTITLTDDEVSRTNAGNLDRLASAFIQFGEDLPLGARGFDGLFAANIAAPLTTGDPLIGENIYIVVGDGHDIASSTSLFVFKSNEQFTAGSPSFVSTIALDRDLGMGQVLLGTPGNVFSNRLGNLPGILAATVPEPAALLPVALLGSIAVCRKRGSAA